MDRTGLAVMRRLGIECIEDPETGLYHKLLETLIGPQLDVESNLSPSLRVFRSGLLRLSGAEA